jgi:hypothetical protein
MFEHVLDRLSQSAGIVSGVGTICAALAMVAAAQISIKFRKADRSGDIAPPHQKLITPENPKQTTTHYPLAFSGKQPRRDEQYLWPVE